MLPNLTPTWPQCSLPSLALNLFWDTAVSKFKNHDHIQYSRSNHRRPKIFSKGTKIFCYDSTLARSRSKLGWDEFPFYVLFMQFGFNWQSIKSFGEAWLSSVPCMDDPKFGPRECASTVTPARPWLDEQGPSSAISNESDSPNYEREPLETRL